MTAITITPGTLTAATGATKTLDFASRIASGTATLVLDYTSSNFEAA